MASLTILKHGVYWREVPTSILTPREAPTTAVVIGTAPIFQAMEGTGNVNKPVLCNNFADAVRQLGYSDEQNPDGTFKWSLCEAMFAYFQMAAVSPIVCINVFDPENYDHKTQIAASVKPIIGSRVTLEANVIPETLMVQDDTGSVLYTLGTDYLLSWSSTGILQISVLPSGTIPQTATDLQVTYCVAKPSAITAADIIGGIDIGTGAETGLELINSIFPKFRLVPGIILAPGWSTDPSVAAIMAAKANSINGLFKAVTYVDIPDTIGYQDVASWKSTNSYVDPMQYVCWPKVTQGDKVLHLSTVAASVTAVTDVDSSPSGIPYMSPSNKLARITGAIQNGSAAFLGMDQANYLNGVGITTALNWESGWRIWGNRTGAWPDNTDPKDYFLAIRRMINWIGNSVVLQFWNKVDMPIRQILVEDITDGVNQWFNGLKSSSYIVDGELLFRPEDNPVQQLADGRIIFHVKVCPFSPAEHIEFVIEYSPSYLDSLFGGS